MINLFYIALALLFSFVVIRKTIQQKMVERESVLWLIATVLMVVISIWPNLLQNIASLLGFVYAPALLFLIAILALTYIVFRQSIAISQLNAKVRELAQRNAIIEYTIDKNMDSNKASE